MTSKTLRYRTYQLLETNSTWLSQLFNAALMLLILANVIAVVVESVRPIHDAYRLEFYVFELISVIIFSIEYCLRIWIAPDNPDYANKKSPRWSFVRSGMAIIDILAIAPFFLSMLIGIDTRILRGLRLLRIFKLTRYSGAMELMVTVIKKELPNIGSAMFVMGILIVLSASAIYVVERDVQPEAFGSIPAALWWATVTLTTVGYGDVIPITATGRIFGGIIMLTGVGLAALPAGILASGYSRELSLRRETYQDELMLAFEDGTLSDDEQKHLERMREELGLTDEEVSRMAKNIEEELVTCPHCGEVIS